MLFKYPKTFHVPWSPGITRDDRVLTSMDQFVGKKVVVSEKLDGENTTIYKNHIHARSLSSGDHPSRSWVKGLWGSISHSIPSGFRICGENLFAKHSITYEALPSYFLVFSIWNDKNVCLSWEETVEWCELLGLHHVPVLYEGAYDEDAVRASWQPLMGGKESEGYVVRLRDAFAYEDFRECVAKMVRKNHVQTDSHWMHTEVVQNKLKE